ncbi:odorant binding protein 6 [Lasioglossum baleicum]|uniref:odorant binding protein 6 n=1 Tax=Lasioglossum baleicum TaxID=434251 RepID=UPI003FCE7FFA
MKLNCEYGHPDTLAYNLEVVAMIQRLHNPSVSWRNLLRGPRNSSFSGAAINLWDHPRKLRLRAHFNHTVNGLIMEGVSYRSSLQLYLGVELSIGLQQFKMKNVSIVFAVGLLFMVVTIWETESKKMTLEEVRNTVKNLRKPCAKKSNATKELLDGQQKGEFPKDERLMCYMLCILSTTKTVRNDEVQYDWFIKNSRLMLEEKYVPRVEHAVEVCRARVPTDVVGCELAWEFGKCVWDIDPELYIAP